MNHILRTVRKIHDLSESPADALKVAWKAYRKLAPKDAARINDIYEEMARSAAAKWRKEIVPASKNGASAAEQPTDEGGLGSKPRNAAAISWAQLLRRTYDIDAELCERCGATMRPVAVILDPEVAQQILAHLSPPSQPPCFASAREPP